MKTNINFTKLRFMMLTLSVVLIVAFWGGTYLRGGFNFGIDFRAGLNQRIKITSSTQLVEGDLNEALSGINALQVRSLGEPLNNEFMVRVGIDDTVEDFQGTIKGQIEKRLKESFGNDSVDIRSSDFVGPSFSGSLTSQTIFLTVFALILILLYIWIRFKLNYAFSAIAAIFHDVLFLVGFIGVLQLEFSTATIAAVLTIIGYSLNDTIVIFDRIRENSKIVKNKTFEEVVNLSLNQSLSRTLITSVTTLIAVTSIFILATGSIKIFALNLIIGVIVGTYSSVFIASSILLTWHNKGTKRVKQNLEKKDESSKKVINFNNN